jgi:putative hemolysin
MLYTASVDELPSQIIIIVVLLLVNAFFAASEMAIISASPVKLDILIENGNKKAKLVKKLQENETKLLSTIQVGITLAGFFSSATAASSLSEIIAQSIGIPEGVSLVIITLILSYFTLVFGELFPKRIALLAPEKVAMTFAKPISIIKTIFRPIVFILSASSDLLVKIFRIKPKETDTVSEDEIKALINSGVESGTINQEEQEFISAIFNFDNLIVKDIMTPRINVFMLDINTPINKFKKLIKQEQYTRVPIYEDDKDNIIGILNLKDIFLFLNASYTKDDLKNILREPIFITESMKCKSLLIELQNKKSQCAIVIDEAGSVSGYVTLEDLIEEITGNIYDEHDEVINKISKVNDDTYILDASVAIHELNRKLNLKITYKNEKYTTVGGYLTSYNEVIPNVMDEIIINNLKFTILEIDTNRIVKAKLEKQKPLS